jgi:hypothetical protein
VLVIRRSAIEHATGAAARVSWPDALIAAIDRRRAPAWVTYAVAAGCAALLLHVLLWATGGLGRGQFSLSYAALAGWSIFCLAALDYLNRVAARAVAAFRPATDLTVGDAGALTRRLTNLPPVAAWLALPLAAAWSAGIYASDPTFFGLATGQGGLDAVIRLIGWINTVAVVVATMRGLWILAIIARSHRMITHLNLFAPDPLFAFSALTVRMALAFIALTFVFTLAFPTVTANPVGLIYPLAVVLPMSLAAFFLPLMGIHEAMAREKRCLRAGVRGRIEKVIEAVHGLADSERAPALDAIQAQKELLMALQIEEDAIHKTSTWPWSPSTLRSLLVAVLLPLAVFVAQNLLGRLLRL